MSAFTECLQYPDVFERVNTCSVVRSDRNSVGLSPRVPTIITDPLPWVVARDRPGGLPVLTSTTVPGVIWRIHHDRPLGECFFCQSLFSAIRCLTLCGRRRTWCVPCHYWFDPTCALADEPADNEQLPQTRVRKDVTFKEIDVRIPAGTRFELRASTRTMHAYTHITKVG